MSHTGIYLEVKALKDVFNKDNWPGDSKRSESYDSEMVQDMDKHITVLL